MTLQEAINTYGFDTWLATSKKPDDKICRPIQIIKEDENEIIFLCEYTKMGVVAVRQSKTNPSNNFILWGGS